MLIREAQPSDADQIDEFEVFDHDVSKAIDDKHCLVAVWDGVLAGYVVYAKQGLIGKDFVKFVVVRDTFRRRGVALALLRGVEAAVGPGRLFISTEADNTPMLCLLDQDGWTPAGQIEGINEGGFAELFFYRDLPA